MSRVRCLRHITIDIYKYLKLSKRHRHEQQCWRHQGNSELFRGITDWWALERTFKIWYRLATEHRSLITYLTRTWKFRNYVAKNSALYIVLRRQLVGTILLKISTISPYFLNNLSIKTRANVNFAHLPLLPLFLHQFIVKFNFQAILDMCSSNFCR